MNTRHTLMLLAASALAPIGYAQTESVPVKTTPTGTLQQMAASPVTAQATVDQRAAKLGTLAMLPADTESFFCMPNMQGTVDRVISSPWLKAFDPDQEELDDIKTHMVDEGILSMTAATGAQSGKAIAHLVPILVRFIHASEKIDEIHFTAPSYDDEDIAEFEAGDEDNDGTDEDIEDAEPTPETRARQEAANKKRMARDAAWNKYREERDKKKAELLAPIMKDLSAAPLPTALYIFELPEDSIANVHEGLSMIQREIERDKDSKELGFSFVEVTHAGMQWQGVHFEGATLAEFFENEKDQNVSEKAIAEAVKPNLAKREAYLLATIQGNKLIVSACTDPAKEIKIAKTPQESILATDKVAFADHCLNKNPDILFYVDKSFQEALPGELVAQLANGKLDITGMHTDAMLKSYAELQKLVQPAAITGVIWQDKGIHAELTYGPDKSINPAATLKLSAMADQPATILYAESVSSQLAIQASMAQAGNMVAQIAEDIAAPELKTIWKGMESIVNGLQGDTALIIDNQGTLPPNLLPVPDLDKLQVPRIGFYATVQNKDSILAGWKTITENFAKLQTKGMGISPSADGPTTTFFNVKTLDMVQTNLNDKELIISASEPLNKQIAETAAKATGTLKGGAFALRFAPIKAMLDKNAPLLQNMGGIPEEATEAVDMTTKAFDGLYGTITPGSKETRVHLYLKAN